MISRLQKDEILIVLPETPYPLRAQGLSMRYLPIIRHLSEKCTLDVIVISRYPVDQANLAPLKEYCRNVSSITHPDSGKVSSITKFIARCGFFLPWALPRSWFCYGLDVVVEEVGKLTNGIVYSTLVCVTGSCFPYIGRVVAKRRIVDFIDSPSLQTRRNVIGSRRSNLIRKFEGWKTFKWETKIIRESDAVLYISATDADSVPQVLAPNGKRHVIPNGFSVNDFTDTLEGAIKSPSIGFFGNMSYFPNIEAVQWLHDNVYLRLKGELPRLSLYVIGRDPDESLIRLGNGESVHVTGEVDVIWPYINAVDIFVFPLLRGAGLKNKILEAMYAGRPVVTTTIGNEGIDGVSGRDIVVCKTPDEFSEAIAKLLDNPEERKRIGETGKRFVEGKFSWTRILKDFQKIVLD